MATHSTPEDGDIVVRHGQRDGKYVYLLRTAPGPDQIVVQTRNDAVAQAVTWAKRQQVRVWMTNGDSDFTLLEDFRLVPPAAR